MEAMVLQQQEPLRYSNGDKLRRVLHFRFVDIEGFERCSVRIMHYVAVGIHFIETMLVFRTLVKLSTIYRHRRLGL